MINVDGRAARIQFLSGSFRLLSPGDYVTCAVSGARIPLNQLRYWNADTQEAYATPEIATRRYAELAARSG